MVTRFNAIIGGLAIVFGIAWTLAPTRMSKYQSQILFYTGPYDEENVNETSILIGRLSGLVLAGLGVLFLVGYLP